MVRRKWVWISLTVGIIVWVGMIAFQGLVDFDLNRHDQADLQFQHGDNILAGTLVLPAGHDDPAIALIIHGDGPQDRFSGQGYLPLINALADAGIGVFTWDKAGTGASTGNWLDQSMSDRVTETLAAYQMVTALDQVSSEKVGFIGFSQAGWVVPEVAGQVTPAFAVLVGAAVDWQLQGDYYTRVRLRTEGLDDAAIAEQLAADQIRDDQFFAAQNIPTDVALGGLSRDRFGFIQRNRDTNAEKAIRMMKGSVLALWGADDLNVDPIRNAAEYGAAFAEKTDQTAITWPDATHGLLRDEPFNAQLTSEWSPLTQFLFAVAGRRAYAAGVIDHMTTWINGAAR